MSKSAGEIRSLLGEKLQFFSNSGQLAQLMQKCKFQRLPDKSKLALYHMIKSIDANSSDFKKRMIEEILEQLGIEESVPCLFIVSQGANFFIRLKLQEGDDFSGHKLLARKAPVDTDGQALTSTTLDGDSYANDPEQEVKFVNYDQPKGDFIRADILLETADQSNEASGDATDYLGSAYMYCKEDGIDSN